MIVIDMDMTKSCGECKCSGTGICREWMKMSGYDMGNKRSLKCPIKCNIDDIKAEIRKLEWYGDDAFWDGVNAVSDIIDKYISGKDGEQNSDQRTGD